MARHDRSGAPRRRRGRLSRLFGYGAFALGVCLVAGLAGFYGVLRFVGREPVVEVPKLVGLSHEEARQAAGAAGVDVEIVEERHDPELGSGRVIEQEPAPGISVRPGRRVRLVVSLGGEVLRLPRIVGRPDRQVAIELRREGLAPTPAAQAPSRRALPGTVLAQVPAPDAAAPPGTPVHRLVSVGPVSIRWVMPDLVGRPLREVEEWINLAGFRQGATRRVPASGRSPGTVIGQLPPAGHPIASKGVIELTVAQ